MEAIPPGHYLKIEFQRDGRAATPVERKYWDFEFPDWGDEDDPSDASAIDRFEAAFAHAVEIRLRADVPVVGYLSGGVDSAYVLATAAQVNGAPLPSFTIHVPDPALDEKDNALQAARAIGGNPTVVEAGANLISDNYAALIAAAECPVLDTSCAALLALSHEVRAHGYKVVLTGEGADEALAGYFWFKIREAARTFDIGDAFRPSTAISRTARKWAARDLSFGEFARIDRMIGGPHAQSILYNLVGTARHRYYSAGMKERLGDHVAYEDLDLDLARMRRWHPLNRSLYLGYRYSLAGCCSVEGRPRCHGEFGRDPLPIPRRGRDRVYRAYPSEMEAARVAKGQIPIAARGGGHCRRTSPGGRRRCSVRHSPKRSWRSHRPLCAIS